MGLLNEEEIRELHLFLKENPDILEHEIKPENFKISYPDKNKFKKPDEHLFVKYIEGELNSEQQTIFLESVHKDSILLKELRLFNKTKITPDFNVTYPHKMRLKRTLPFYYIQVFRAAAGLVFILMLYVFLKIVIYRKNDSPPPVIVQVNKNNNKVPKNQFIKEPDSAKASLSSQNFIRSFNVKKNYSHNDNNINVKTENSISTPDIYTDNHFVTSTEVKEKSTDEIQMAVIVEKNPEVISTESINAGENYLEQNKVYDSKSTSIRYYSLESIPFEEDTLAVKTPKTIFHKIKQVVSQYILVHSLSLAHLSDKKNTQ